MGKNVRHKQKRTLLELKTTYVVFKNVSPLLKRKDALLRRECVFFRICRLGKHTYACKKSTVVDTDKIANVNLKKIGYLAKNIKRRLRSVGAPL